MSVFLSPLAGSGAQFFTNTGTPLVGGKIWTYQAGTTTPEATYTSESGTTPHANPIILDANGRVPDQIWLSQGVSYKFVLMTSTNVTLGTFDDLAGINDISISGVAWTDILGTPTTLAGYGITDGITAATVVSTYAPIASPVFTGTAQIPDNAPSSANFPIGYRDAPQVSKTNTYTLILSDAGKSVLMNGTSLTLMIPANGTVAFPVGTVILAINTNTTTLSVDITTDTLTLANSTTTGVRSVARNGMAVLHKIGSTSWLIGGPGVS